MLINYLSSQTSLIEKQDHQKHQKNSENISKDGFFVHQKPYNTQSQKERRHRKTQILVDFKERYLIKNVFYWLIGYDARDGASHHRNNAQVGNEGMQSIWLDFFKPVVKVSEISP